MEYNVVAHLKVYLDDPSAMESVKDGIGKLAKVQEFREEEIGFGIKVLKVNLLMMDSEGGMDQLEEKIMNISNVSQVEVESVGRV